jgi:hypothetical protein
MTHATPIQCSQATIDVVLVGGPSDIPPSDRMIHGVSLDDVKIKVPHRGGYEHFVRDVSQYSEGESALPSSSDFAATVTYHWSTRTEVAE